MLVGLKEILAMVQKGEFAIPAFNVYNMETVQAVVAAAEECRAPIIMQTYSRLFSSDVAFYLAPSVLAAASRATIPICYHLDHGANRQAVLRALRYGCTGIMYDCSSLPFEDNVTATKEIVTLCSETGIDVEGELGHIGSAADDLSSDYTDPNEAEEFVKRTGVVSLAVQVGTAHGHYKKTPKVAIDRIREISSRLSVPLVLHGGSGIPDDQIQAAIRAGIGKVNFGTDVCFSFLDKIFETSRSIVAIDMFMRDATESVKQFAIEKIKLLGAHDRV